ncbi:MAG: hypothetical protein WDZ44_00715 [Candidatus Spechtbacterales bacterium]
MDPQLLIYVRQARNAGLNDDQISAQLREQGWQEVAIREAVGAGKPETVLPEFERPQGLPAGQYSADIPESSAPRSGHKKILIGVGAIFAVLLVISGGMLAVLATNTWSPLWSPFRPDPRMVLSDAVNGSVDTDLASVVAELIMGMREENGNEFFSAVVSATGDVDARDKREPKMRFGIDGTVDVEGASFKANVDMISVGGALYGKVNEFPFLSLLIGEGLEDIRNVWIQLADEEYEEPIEQDTQSVVEIIEFLQEDQTFSIEELGDERVGGANAYHYRITVPAEHLEAFSQLLDGGNPDGIGGDLLGEIDSFASGTAQDGLMVLEVWLDKRTSLPLRLRVQQDSLIDEISKQELSFALSIDLRYPAELSEPIVAPQEYKTSDELFADTPAAISARDVTRINDMRRAQLLLEQHYEQYGFYPLTQNVCVNTEVGGEVATFFSTNDLVDPKEEQYYSYGSNSTGTTYVLAAYMEDIENTALEDDIDSTILGCNCADPLYCTQ